jgi:hypothetical protein
MKLLETVLLGAAAVALSAPVAAAANVTGSEREPVRIRMECSWTKATERARCNSYDVPVGKRLVVETMRVDAFLTPSADVSVHMEDAEEPGSVKPTVLRKQAGRHMLYGRRIVADSGTTVNINYRPSEELRQYPPSGTTTIQLIGYLEPAL